ncbi:hypothetical protein [Austwickia chelonae]|uniref:hypothetical protein n=1 Tax=Austwickia chelonae TaxID=100225 RepID=UPI000E26E738|nr:hypothetical protein [Austwickia chelonae]
MQDQQKALISQLKALLDGTSEAERANLAYDLLGEIYDHAKFKAPGGEGDDGRDGPERRGLGAARDLLRTHKTNAMNRSQQGGS